MFSRIKPLIYLILIIATMSAITIASQKPAQQSENENRQDIVKLNVLVTDRNGQIVKGLGKDDFRLKEEGKDQQLTFFSNDDLPLRCGILIDSSGSMEPHHAKAIESARIIIQKNRSGDETFLARLNGSSLEKLEDWTSDTKKLLDALQRPYKSEGNTALFSAMWVCLDHMARRSEKENPSKYRQALVIITDGLDLGSKHTFRDVIKKLQSQNVQVFTLGFLTRPKATSIFEADGNKTATENLSIIAKETGGAAFFHFSGDVFKKSAEFVSESLRSQYVVGYRSSLAPDKDSFRKVKVSVSDGPDGQNRSVYARSGYWPQIYKPQIYKPQGQ